LGVAGYSGATVPDFHRLPHPAAGASYEAAPWLVNRAGGRTDTMRYKEAMEWERCLRQIPDIREARIVR
jgi:hypothetical protein